MDTREIAILAAQAAGEKKAEDIVVMRVAEQLVITDYFVICTGRNDRQVKVIAEEIEKVLLAEVRMKPIGREGEAEGRWILLDFADVVVHIFQPDEREFYRLEKLWSDAETVEVPESTRAVEQIDL